MPWASRSLGLSTPASLAISRTLFAVAGFIVRLFFPKTSVFIRNYRRFIPDLVFSNNFFSDLLWYFDRGGGGRQKQGRSWFVAFCVRHLA
jgi:hypothetical protein